MSEQTEIPVEKIEVNEAVVVETKRKSSVTIKTLKSWFEQSKRIAENKLLTEADEKELLRITKTVKQKFIEENF